MALTFDERYNGSMVKYLSAFLFSITLAGSAPVQLAPINSGESGLQVIRFSWSKYRPSRLSLETGLPRADTGVAERAEDFRLERQMVLQRRRDPQNRSRDENLEERRWWRQLRLPERGSSSSWPTSHSRYRYTIELENTAAKKVKAVEWDYLFVDPGTNQEKQRHRFTSEVGIKPGKRKKVTAYSEAGPYGVVDVKGLSSDAAGEKVVIRRIVYADKSVWER